MAREILFKLVDLLLIIVIGWISKKELSLQIKFHWKNSIIYPDYKKTKIINFNKIPWTMSNSDLAKKI